MQCTVHEYLVKLVCHWIGQCPGCFCFEGDAPAGAKLPTLPLLHCPTVTCLETYFQPFCGKEISRAFKMTFCNKGTRSVQPIKDFKQTNFCTTFLFFSVEGLCGISVVSLPRVYWPQEGLIPAGFPALSALTYVWGAKHSSFPCLAIPCRPGTATCVRNHHDDHQMLPPTSHGTWLPSEVET